MDRIKEAFRVKMSFNGEEVIMNLYDNPTSRELLELLPMTITLEDYAGTEKIGYLTNKLTTEGAPSGIRPSVGDLTYYAPWGNLAIFYKDFRLSNGLIKLGHIDSGIEKLEKIRDKAVVKIENTN
jgi:hypothetical protein